MSEKFRKVVNAPHRAMGRLTKKIAQSNTNTFVRATGMTTTALFQFLLWAAKYTTLDNHLLRAMERRNASKEISKNKNGENKKISEFLKKYPNLSAHLLYYLMFVMTLGGVKMARDSQTDVAHVAPQEYLIGQTVKRVQPNTYGAYLERMRSITPFLIADLLAKEGVKVDKKTGLHIPYKDSRGVWTIGFGSTILPDGTSVTKDTKPITTQQAYDLARWHLEHGETYFTMYCYNVAMEGVDINNTAEALAMASIIYNTGTKMIENPRDKNHRERFERLRQDFKKYGTNMPDNLVRQRFAEFPTTAETSFGRAWLHGKSSNVVAGRIGNFLVGGTGLRWRRWLEAGVLTGNVTPEMLMECPMGGMYEFYKMVGGEKTKFFTGDEEHRTVNNKLYAKFRKWVKNPVDRHGKSIANAPKVKDFLPENILAQCQNNKCELGTDINVYAQAPRVIRSAPIVSFDAVPASQDYDKLYASATSAYKKGKYSDAIDKFLSLIEKAPNDAGLRNDLAATYNKMAKYDMAIMQSREVITRIKDKKQFGAAYYNAGVAYEQKGNLQRALANYRLAVANGNKRAQSDVVRVTQLARVKNVKNARGKRFVFNSGIEKVKKSDIVKMRNVHDLATHDDYVA